MIAEAIAADALITSLIKNDENVPQAAQIVTNSSDRYTLLFNMPTTLLNSPELEAIEEVEYWLESTKLRAK